ncbi:MAG: multidrug resistance efflux pump [Phycisphaerales bacterium]|nr:multidrug resistance efflux pump [Phycisphaerales bacterium]
MPDSAPPTTTPPATTPAIAPPAEAVPIASPPASPVAVPRRRHSIRWVILILVLVIAGIVGVPWVMHSLHTASTDDAYVNGHLTFVAPRVAGQVAKVLVDDNNRVRRGDLLVQLDKEPYEVQRSIAEAAVTAAKAELATAKAQARGTVGQARSARFALERAIEDVDNQAALLKARIATLNAKKASLNKAQADYDRAMPLVQSNALSKEDFGTRTAALQVAQAQVEEAVQGVYQLRVALGLDIPTDPNADLSKVPPDLDQTFSAVRQAQASVIQAISVLGVEDSYNKGPRQMIADFYKRDPQGDIDKIYAVLLKDAPTIKQAEAKLAQADRNLDQANLDLKYCDVVAEIDGVVTRRNVNPGNNVVIGQSIMGVRSLTDIWVDANFKETQLAGLKIGLPVDLDVDMYGSRKVFKGRISGFTMGTGSTLALLPAENATGNFVKVVQRLPVRIDLIDYTPDEAPLFIGLSVEPTVDLTAEPSGPNAGKLLQPLMVTAVPSTTPSMVPSTAPVAVEARP